MIFLGPSSIEWPALFRLLLIEQGIISMPGIIQPGAVVAERSMLIDTALQVEPHVTDAVRVQQVFAARVI